MFSTVSAERKEINLSYSVPGNLLGAGKRPKNARKTPEEYLEGMTVEALTAWGKVQRSQAKVRATFFPSVDEAIK